MYIRGFFCCAELLVPAHAFALLAIARLPVRLIRVPGETVSYALMDWKSLASPRGPCRAAQRRKRLSNASE